MTAAPSPIPPAWHPDPSGRNQYRYWDGASWTDWVANDGVQATDPLISQTPLSVTQATEPLPATSRTRQEKATPKQDEVTRSGYLLLGADGYPNTEVAGEFARMDSIHRAIGRKPKKDDEIERTELLAALVPEPSNTYDS